MSTPPSAPGTAAGSGAPQRPPSSRRWLGIGLTVALVVVILVMAAYAVVLVRDRDSAATGSTISTTPTTSSAEPSTTPPQSSSRPTATTTAPPAQVDTSTAIWPVTSSAVRYSDPVAAARGFAVDFAGFAAPVLGQFQQGDSRSGEVAIQAAAKGPVTTVLVRQLQDGHWWVLGANTEQIRLDSPAAGDLVRNPLTLTGAAHAYEGHVTVTLREDGVAAPLASGFVTGRGDAMGPFQGQLPFARTPTQRYGALLLTVESADNGQLWQATVIRIRLQS